MNRSAIIDIVRQKLDEVTPFENTESDTVDLIDLCLDEAAIEILQTVPLNTIRPYKLSVDEEYYYLREDNVVVLELPDDFLRLHSFQIDGWQKVVTKAYDEESSIANLQKNPYTRGGIVKPVCIIGYKISESEGSTSDSIGSYVTKHMYIYSAPESNKIGYLKHWYIKRLLPEQLQSNLIDPLAWQCAGNILHITGNHEQAQVCYLHVAKFIKDNTFP